MTPMGMPEKGFGGRERWLKRRERNQKQPSPTAVGPRLPSAWPRSPASCVSARGREGALCCRHQPHCGEPTDWLLQQSMQRGPHACLPASLQPQVSQHTAASSAWRQEPYRPKLHMVSPHMSNEDAPELWAAEPGPCPHCGRLGSPCLQSGQEGFWSTQATMLQDIGLVMIGPERKAVWVAILLAFFNQGCASTAVINYAPTVLEGAGVRNYADATAWTAMITGAKVGPCRAASAACAQWHTGCTAFRHLAAEHQGTFVCTGQLCALWHPPVKGEDHSCRGLKPCIRPVPGVLHASAGHSHPSAALLLVSCSPLCQYGICC